jgi:ABC-2 type transport system permease protein
MDSLGSYVDFLWAMTQKEIRARYKRAVFGFLWIVLSPFLQMLIIGFVFSFFIKIPDYLLFLFSGLLVWNFFSLSVSKATPSIVYDRALLKKAKFPIEAIPLSIVLSNFVQLIISFFLFLLVLLFLGKLAYPQILFIFPALFWILLLCLGISLLLAGLNVRYRDVNFFTQALLILWFYATPVLFNLSLIPSKFYPVFYLNPLTFAFELVHQALLGQGVLDLKILISNIVVGIAICSFGIFVFKKESKFFVDWL